MRRGGRGRIRIADHSADREHPMTVVYFLVLPHLTLLDLAGPAEILQAAARFGVAIHLRFIGPAHAVGSSVGIGLAEIAPLPVSLPEGAILFIPGAANSLQDYECPEALEAIAWLARVLKPEHTLCAICSAALLAARAGLLSGRDCTTHFSLQDRLARLDPALRVMPNRLFVRDGNIITSAGAASGIDIALFLLSRLHGPALAAKVAELLVIYFHRDADDPQLSPWIAFRAHEDPRIRAAQALVAKNPQRDWTVARLARELHVGERHLARLFRAHAGISPSAYIRSLRVAASRQMVRHTRLSMEQIATACGFQSSEQMRRAWKKLGQPVPSALRRSAADQ
jgi:transcriptional regulator GlxA family with amidase domain